MIKAFISYSHKDRGLAKDLKVALQKYNLSAFLAHDDIEPSDEWVKKIFKELVNCHVFLPLLTESFTKSMWTDQEAGIAFYGKKLIIPLKVEVNPYGFISRYQALRLNPDRLTMACKRIAEIISKDPDHGEMFRDGIIEIFGDSGTFAVAAKNAEQLVSFDGYTIRQVRQIIYHVIESGQIHSSYDARDILRPFIRKFRSKLNQNLLDKFDAAMSR